MLKSTMWRSRSNGEPAAASPSSGVVLAAGACQRPSVFMACVLLMVVDSFGVTSATLDSQDARVCARAHAAGPQRALPHRPLDLWSVECSMHDDGPTASMTPTFDASG